MIIMAFEVTTHSKILNPTITVDTAAYTIGDSMGGKITLANAVRKVGGTCTLTNLTIIDKGNVRPTFNIVIFSSDPTVATITDQAPFVLGTDASKVIGVIPIYSIDYQSVAGMSIGTLQLGNIILDANETFNNTTSLYAAIVATAANDMVAAGDLSVKFGVIQD
jgi:hypothetical protein